MWDIIIFTVNYYSHCKKTAKNYSGILILVQAYSPSPAPEYVALYIGPSEASLYYNNNYSHLYVCDGRTARILS